MNEFDDIASQYARGSQQPQLPPAMMQQAQHGAQQTPAPQPPPMPFTQADSLQLQRLQQGMSSAQKQVNDGTISEEDGQKFQTMIQAQLAPLQQRQQAQQAQAEKKSIEAAMHQMAQQESINKVHRLGRAQSFQEEVVVYVDPVTGHTAHMIQDHKGDWKELPFERETERERMRQDQMKLATGEAPPSFTAGTATPGPMTGGQGEQPKTLDDMANAARQQQTAEPGPSAASALAQPEGIPAPQEIPNEFAVQPSQPAPAPKGPGEPQIITGQEHAGVRLGENPADFSYNEHGEVQRGQSAPAAHLEQEFMRRAERAIPRPRSTGNGSVDAHLLSQWQQRVHSLAAQLLGNHQRHEEHRDQQEGLSKEHQRAEAARTAEHSRHEEFMQKQKREEAATRAAIIKAKADKGITLEWEQKNLKQKEADVRQEIKAHLEANPRANLAGTWMEDPRREAERRHTEEDLPFWLKRMEERKKMGLPPEAGAPNAPNASSGEPVRTGGLPKEQADLPATSVAPGKVAEVASHLDAWIKAVPQKREGDMATLHEHLADMKKIIAPAIREKRHLTVGERKEYDDQQAKVHTLMRGHGSAAHILSLVPPPAEPAKAAPPANNLGAF